jgi:NitT/TauT family transport system substrate-binding protein/sulfonate transport system substrate-binding protein
MYQNRAGDDQRPAQRAAGRQHHGLDSVPRGRVARPAARADRHLHGDATRQYYADNNSIVASASSGIKEKDIKALKGRKIGLPRGTGAEGYLLGILGENGMKITDVTLINLKPSDQVTAAAAGRTWTPSAAWEPWATTAAVRVPGRCASTSGGCESCYDPGSILTTSRSSSRRRDAAPLHGRVRGGASVAAPALDEAAEINTRWVTGVDLRHHEAAIRRSNYDHRLSKNTLEGYTKKAIPMLVADKRMARTVDPRRSWMRSSTSTRSVRRRNSSATCRRFRRTGGCDVTS